MLKFTGKRANPHNIAEEWSKESLWNEEEQHCLAERSQYADDSKCHSCKVAKCITHKYT